MADKLTDDEKKFLDDGGELITEETLQNGEERRAGEGQTPARLSETDLRFHQDAVNKAYKDMCEINDRIQASDSFDGELNAEWERAEKVFDEHQDKLNAHKAYQERSAHRQEKLDSMRNKTSRLSAGARAALVGNRADSRDLNADDLYDCLQDNSQVVNEAYSAWFKGQLKQFSHITESEKKACDKLGFDPRDGELFIPLLSNAHYQEAVDIFRDETAGINQLSGRGKHRAAVKERFKNSLSTQTPLAAPGTENYLFGTTFQTSLEEALLAYGGIVGNVDVLRTPDGNPIYMPTMNDTTNQGRMLSEAVALPAAAGATIASALPSFGNMILNAYIGTSDRVALSNSLAQDNQIMLIQRLPEILGTRIGRLKNRMGTNGLGAGSEQPDGIVPQSSLGVTAAAATAVVLDEIFDMCHAIDPAIREAHNCKFMFNDSTLSMLRKIKDNEGRYLWQVDARSGAPQTLDTHEFIINQDMPSVGTGNQSILFGNLMAYKWREVAGGSGDNSGIRLVVLRELYAESDQVGYVAFTRFDGRLLNAGDNPVIHLIHP